MSAESEVPTPFSASYARDGGDTSLAISVNDITFTSRVESRDATDDDYRAWWHAYVMGEPIEFPRVTQPLRIVDLFCGPGGLSQGVGLAARTLGFGVRHQLAVDVDREALQVYAANHQPKLILNESTASLVSYTLDEQSALTSFHGLPQIRDDRVAAMAGDVDLLIAGPPCQGHSTANSKRRFFDNRNLLYLTVPAIAIALEIPTVIIENVPGVQASQQGVVGLTMKLLEFYGYQVTEGVANAANLGWAQNRRRYFMIASKIAHPLPFKKQVLPALAREPMSISHLLEDLVNCEPTGFMTESPELSADNTKRINVLHDQGLYDLPDNHRNRRAQEIGTTYRSVYGRMYWDRPAQTITTGFMTPGRGRYVHPIKRRTLLPIEAARLQGFPDSYVFDAFGQVPSRSSLAKWIGDAVPTPLGFAAGLSALARFAKR